MLVNVCPNCGSDNIRFEKYKKGGEPHPVHMEWTHCLDCDAWSVFPAKRDDSQPSPQPSPPVDPQPYPVYHEPQRDGFFGTVFSYGKGIIAVPIAGALWLAATLGIIIVLSIVSSIEDTVFWVLLGSSGAFYIFVIAPRVWRWASGQRYQKRRGGRSWSIVKWLLIVIALLACVIVGLSLLGPAIEELW